MSTKETAKPASKKKFSKDDVKALYKAIECGWKDKALSLAFAASGSYKVHKRGSGSLGGDNVGVRSSDKHDGRW